MRRHAKASSAGSTPGRFPGHRKLAAPTLFGTLLALLILTVPSASAVPPQLPQRGYELASQYPTGGVPIVEAPGWQNASEDGNRIAIGTLDFLVNSTIPPFPDDPRSSNGGQIQYLFDRGSDSWQHRTEVGVGSEGWSSNLERLLTTTKSDGVGSDFAFTDARADPDDQNHSFDVYQWQPGGSLVWISRDPRIPVGTPQTTGGDAGTAKRNGSFTMSADGRIVVFNSKRQLLDADTTPADGNGFGGRAASLYKWEDGQLSFIGVRPDGSVPAMGSALGDQLGDTSSRYAVSRDGSRVIFSALRGETFGTGSALYVQTDGQPTVEATKEEGVPPLPAGQPYDVTYRSASADGSRVFFTSASRLTADSGAGGVAGGATDLYAYDVETDTLRDLTPRLDGLEDPNVEPAAADRADVLGVADNSEDGKRIYFVANAQYPTAPNPEGNLPSPSGRNLYMAELDGIDDPVTLSFVGSLGPEDIGDWQRQWEGYNGPGNINAGKTALASADGSVLGFASLESLTGQPLGGTGQLFVYNAEAGTLDCASCPSDGSLPTDSVNKYFRGGEGSNSEIRADWQGDAGIRRWVSSEGAVFFTTSTALLPADQNTVNDVYEFHDGALGLISPGSVGTATAQLSNASRDGSTVFFNTVKALVPQDKEPGIPKIYAARVGGGFPFVAPPPPCDFNAGACEGAPSTAPETPGAGTAAFQGPGNPKPNTKRACPKGKRKVRAKGKVRCVKRHHERTAKNNRRAGR